MSSQDAKKKFEAVFPSLVEDLKENAKQYNLPENALKWYEDVCNAFLPDSHRSSPPSTPSSP